MCKVNKKLALINTFCISYSLLMLGFYHYSYAIIYTKPEESMKLMQYFCFDLGASWPSFIDLSKTLAEQILNSGKEKDIDHDDDRQLLLDDLHDPFLSAAAKALEKSAGADCRTPLYNHG